MATNAKKLTDPKAKGQYKMAAVEELAIGAKKSLSLCATENDIQLSANAEASWVKGVNYAKNSGAKAGFDLNLVSNELVLKLKDIPVGKLLSAFSQCFQLFRSELELGMYEEAQSTWAKGVLYAKAIGFICNFDLNMV